MLPTSGHLFYLWSSYPFILGWCMVYAVCCMLYVVCCVLDCICKLYADCSLRCAACICRFVVCYLLSRTLSFNCVRACCVSLSCNIISLSTPQRVCRLRSSDQNRNEVHRLLTLINTYQNTLSNRRWILSFKCAAQFISILVQFSQLPSVRLQS
jgi:hypothetical protein